MRDATSTCTEDATHHKQRSPCWNGTLCKVVNHHLETDKAKDERHSLVEKAQLIHEDSNERVESPKGDDGKDVGRVDNERVERDSKHLGGSTHHSGQYTRLV